MRPRPSLFAALALSACGSLDTPSLDEPVSVCDTEAPTLSWSAVEDAGYELTLRAEDGTEQTYTVDAGTTSWSPESPLAAGTWEFAVRAVTEKKEGEPSAAGTFVVKPTPPAPTLSGATEICFNGELALDADGEGTIRWTSPTGDTAEGAELRTAPAAGTWSAVATLDGCASPAAETAVTIVDGALRFSQMESADFAANVNDQVLVLADQVTLEPVDFSTGDGADGVYAPSEDVDLPSGTYAFTSISVPAGVTVRVVGDEPLVLLSQGSVVIDGSLDVSGQNGIDGVTFDRAGVGGEGVAGGADGGDGVYVGGPTDGLPGEGPGGGVAGTGWTGGGGGAHATAGLSASGEEVVDAYGDPALTEGMAGSGGGGGSGGNSCGSGGGGGGGGFVRIAAPSVRVGASGSISVDGGDGGSDGDGNCGGGGGGSAGSLFIVAPDVTVVDGGQLSAVGGAPGSTTFSGGAAAAGSAGRIRIDAGTLTVGGESSVLPEIGYRGPLYAMAGSTRAAVSGDRVCAWGRLEFDADTPAGTALVVDVLDASGGVLVGDVSSGTDLSGVSALDGVGEVGVRASLTGDGFSSPILFSWDLDYRGR